MSKRIIFAENLGLSSSDDEENIGAIELDKDMCTSSEIDSLFKIKYKIAHEMSATMKREFIMKLCTNTSFTKVAAGTSGATVYIYDICQERGLIKSACLPCSSSISDQPASICGLNFLNEDSSILVVGTTDGHLFVYDVRQNYSRMSFKRGPKHLDVPKDYLCLDRNANSRLLCVGTANYRDMVQLLFFDLRQRKLMGCYSESHQGDMTDIKFHPQNPDILCTGSVDGLINIFDLHETSEEDALLTTFNSESSVYKLNWHKTLYEKDIISCMTTTNDLKLYNSEEYDLVAEFEWPKITDAIKRKAPSNCHLINTHSTLDNKIFSLVGTNFNKGEILRSVQLKDQMIPLANFKGNKQIIRDSVFEMNSNALITGGEGGFLTLWTQEDRLNDSTQNYSQELKHKIKRGSHKTNPY
ncbi:WD repeat-containing protein 89 [Glossina fuscipes fuscipes]